MPYVDGIYVPDYSAPEADVPADFLLMQQSLRGRINRTHASTATRDTAIQALPASARQGAQVYVPGVGFMGYTKAADPYDASDASWWKFDRIKGGQLDFTAAEGNGMYRVHKDLCWFDGQPPSAIIPWAIMDDPSYEFKAGIPRRDGSGYLFRCYNRVTGVQNTGAAAMMWMAVR